jgi:ribose transport system substrate-binding protein
MHRDIKPRRTWFLAAVVVPLLCGVGTAARADARSCQGLTIPPPFISSTEVNIKDFSMYHARKPGQKMTFALLLFSRGFEWMIGLENAFVAESKKMGVTPIVLDADSSDQTQLAQIEDMLSKKVDAIILTPNSNDGLIPGVQAARKAGVVLTTAEGIVPGGLVPLRVGYDNARAGAIAADYLAEHLRDTGSVMETRGALASLSSKGRHDGFVAEMTKYPHIKVISRNTEWIATNAQNATSDTLTSDPSLGGIYSHNDEMVTGIVAALAENGNTAPEGQSGHVYVVGIDGTPNALQRLKTGSESISIVQDPFDQGRLIVENTYKFITGENVPAVTLVQPYTVDKATADCPRLWGNRGGTP